MRGSFLRPYYYTRIRRESTGHATPRSFLPAPGALDGAAPPVAEGGALVRTEARLEDAIGVPAGGEGIGRGPEAGGEAGEGGGAESRRFGDGGALDRDAEQVRLPLHQ